MESHRATISRRGLSFVELTIGIAITGVIMAALATFLAAVGQGWKQTATQNASSQSVAVSGQQMHRAIGGMLNIAQVKSGGGAGESAYLFFWKEDSFGEVADQKAQLGEMSLIEYDPATQAVWLYQAKPEASMSPTERALAASDSWGDSTSPEVVTYFKSSDILAARTAVVGGGTGPEATKVTAAQMAAFVPSGGRPMALYELSLDHAGIASTSSGTVALRSAQTASNLAGNADD